MPNVETIIRSVCVDEDDRDFLRAAFDEMWEQCCGRYAGLANDQRDRVRERLACCFALITSGIAAVTREQAKECANRLCETLCDTGSLIGCSRTLDFSDIE